MLFFGKIRKISKKFQKLKTFEYFFVPFAAKKKSLKIRVNPWFTSV